MKIKHIVLLILSVLIVMSCTQKRLANHGRTVAKSHTIKLLVTGDGAGASMKVNTGAMNGCINQDDGCMVFQKNETGKILFTMRGNHVGFHLTQLKICMGADAPDPIDENCPLPIPNALDFYVTDSNGVSRIPNPFTGKVEWSYSDNVKSFNLFDRNLLKQEYFYLVIACNGPDPDSDNCPVADPPMDNKGIN
jgi:hypothetical protein